MSDRFGEIIELDAFRSGPRLIGEIARGAFFNIARVTSQDVVRNALYAERRKANVLRETIKRAERLIVFVTHAGVGGDEVASVRLSFVAGLDFARDQLDAVTRTVRDLEGALAANQSTDEPTPAA